MREEVGRNGAGGDESINVLICDVCDINCYVESYFVEDSEQDFCPRCYKTSHFYDIEKNIDKGEHRCCGKFSYIMPDREVVAQTLIDVLVQVEKERQLALNDPDIFAAARQGHVDSLIYYVERLKVDVDSIDFGGNTALHIACMLRQQKVT